MTDQQEIEFVLRVMYALSLGSLVGFERDWRGHEAGIRTLGMVAGGAAIFGEISLLSEESRIAAAVVQGVGFLCAGIIFQGSRGPRGLTTAATAWATAGIGLMVAYQLYIAAGLLTVAFAVLLELQPLTDWILSFSPDVRRARRRIRHGEVDTAEQPSVGSQQGPPGS